MHWLRQMRHTWDAVSNTWNQWVLGYTSERQTRFLSRLGMDGATWQNMVIALIVSSGAILGLLALALLLRLARRRVEPVQREYLRYCERMARLGSPRRPGEGPRDFTTRVSMQFPQLRGQVQRIGALYVALRYGGEEDPQVLEEFRRAVNNLGSDQP
jgi:protein-glutamine gamma-glutamyltransferase